MNTIDDSNHIWAIRRSISLGIKKIGGEKKSEDVVVPPASVPHFLAELESLAFECGIKVLGYGHLGDGNIHVNILKMNASDKDIIIKRGMKVAQMVIAPFIKASIKEVSNVQNDTKRGEGGFGSTGV